MSDKLVAIMQKAHELSLISKDLIDSAKDMLMLEHAVSNMTPTDPFISSFAIFILTCFIGYYVIWNVTPALHTPLMSITNAISGIIIIGGMHIVGASESFSISSVIGLFAVFLISINIFGGFTITVRMIRMLSQKKISQSK